MDFDFSEICEKTGITKEDVAATLLNNDFIKYFKGRNVLCINKELFDRIKAKKEEPALKVDPECLVWKEPKFLSQTPSK